jgi:tripartite-type tricarboxylate transporter receptor subunit TctC
MQKKFRIVKLAFCLLLSISVLSFPVFESLHAQNYPVKPINIVIPLGAGGQNDLLIRMLSPLAVGGPHQDRRRRRDRLE